MTNIEQGTVWDGTGMRNVILGDFEGMDKSGSFQMNKNIGNPLETSC